MDRRWREVGSVVSVVVFGAVAFSIFSGGGLFRLPLGLVGSGLFVFVPLVFVLVIGLIVWSFVQKRRTNDAYAALVAGTMWSPTTSPLGLDAGRWVQLQSLPRGDRRFGVRHGVVGPEVLRVAGEQVPTQTAVFRWEWEERSQDSEGRSSYRTRSTVVAATRVPVACPPIAIGDEGLLAWLGIGGRGDMQVESEAFNRAFRVRVPEVERPTAIRLLDAGFQQVLLDRFRGREVELFGDVCLLAGKPHRKDPSLYGELGWYPQAEADLLALVAAVPEGFWRAVRCDGTPEAVPPPPLPLPTAPVEESPSWPEAAP